MRLVVFIEWPMQQFRSIAATFAPDARSNSRDAHVMPDEDLPIALASRALYCHKTECAFAGLDAGPNLEQNPPHLLLEQGRLERMKSPKDERTRLAAPDRRRQRRQRRASAAAAAAAAAGQVRGRLFVLQIATSRSQASASFRDECRHPLGMPTARSP